MIKQRDSRAGFCGAQKPSEPSIKLTNFGAVYQITLSAMRSFPVLATQLLILWLAAITPKSAAAAVTSWRFTVIAQSSTPLPGQTGADWLLSLPAVSGGNIAFQPHHSDSVNFGGVYLWTDSTFLRIADNNMSKPSGGPFSSAWWAPLGNNDISISGTNIFFSTAEDGAFVSINGQLKGLLPSGYTLDSARIQNDTVFGVVNSGSVAIGVVSYRDGVFTKILQNGDQVLGKKINGAFGQIIPSGDSAMFSCDFKYENSSTLNQALFRYSNGALDIVSIEPYAPVSPPHWFQSFGYDGSAASVIKNNGEGVLEFKNGNWNTIADFNTIVPGRTFPFTRFTDIARVKDTTIFRGGWDTGHGLFISRPGAPLEEIAANDKSLSGRTPIGIYFNPAGFDGDNIAFLATYSLSIADEVLYLVTADIPHLNPTLIGQKLRVQWSAIVGATYRVETASQLAQALWTNAGSLTAQTETASFDLDILGAETFVRVARLP